MSKKNVILNFGFRRVIYNYVSKYPGLHFREICRRLNISRSTLDYHLNYLKKNNLIFAETCGRYKRYYPVNEICESDKKILNMLRQKVPRKIILYLLSHPGSSLVTIGKKLDKNPRTINFHMKKLIDLKVVEFYREGNEIIYSISGRKIGEIFELLITFKGRLFDKDADFDVDWFDEYTANPVLEKIMNTIYEILPHPYHS